MTQTGRKGRKCRWRHNPDKFAEPKRHHTKQLVANHSCGWVVGSMSRPLQDGREPQIMRVPFLKGALDVDLTTDLPRHRHSLFLEVSVNPTSSCVSKTSRKSLWPELTGARMVNMTMSLSISCWIRHQI